VTLLSKERAPRSACDRKDRAGQRRRDGLIRTQLVDLQRARILAAMFDLIFEHGASNVTVAHVVERSGISRRTFYEIFDDRDECLLAAFQDAISYASERVLPAYRAGNGWRERIRAALLELLRFLDEEPVLARLLIVESHSGGAGTLALRNELVAKLTETLEQGREATKNSPSRSQTKTGFSPPPLTGEGLVGGVLTVIHSRLVERDREPLIKLTNQLMSMIVLPYLGPTLAGRELERPISSSTGTSKDSALLSDPFKDAGMRLTYRTVRVLAAIGEHPGASNRLIAETAEIKDQGQISKLLRRLERIAMIVNASPDPGQGAPNKWTLTTNGDKAVTTIKTHTQNQRPESCKQ
jgi:AcrR family transcriptional regulator/DNA-binding MarR family transcriptional regulator